MSIFGKDKDPVRSEEFKALSSDIVLLNKNILILTARVEKLEDQLQRLRGKVYQGQQAEDSNSPFSNPFG